MFNTTQKCLFYRSCCFVLLSRPFFIEIAYTLFGFQLLSILVMFYRFSYFASRMQWINCLYSYHVCFVTSLSIALYCSFIWTVFSDLVSIPLLCIQALSSISFRDLSLLQGLFFFFPQVLHLQLQYIPAQYYYIFVHSNWYFHRFPIDFLMHCTYWWLGN